MKRHLPILPALLAGIALAQPAPTAAQARSEIISAAREVMKEAHFATFITLGEGGQPQARVLDPSEPDADLTVWLGTNLVTRKVAQIQKNPRATLFYFDKASTSYVSLLGSAQLVSDPLEKQRHWQAQWASYFPQGAKDPNFVLIRFVPRTLEAVSLTHKLMNDPHTWRPVTLELK